MKYLIFILFSYIFAGCSFYNPFIPPPSGGYREYKEEPTTCEPISSDPMYRATMRPYTVNGKRYCPTVVKVGDTFEGIASWYGDAFHGGMTSNGEYYNMYDYTAAHKTLPINTLVKVTNLSNNLSTTVRINDRGPFVENRIIDLSYQAAADIGMIKNGTAKVRLEVIEFDENANKYAHKPTQKNSPSKSVWKRYNPNEFVSKVKPTDKKVVTGGEYIIQIASFSNRDRALALKEKCYNRDSNYNPHIKEKIYNGQTIYKVMIGGFKSIKEAKDFISEANYKGAFVIRN